MGCKGELRVKVEAQKLQRGVRGRIGDGCAIQQEGEVRVILGRRVRCRAGEDHALSFFRVKSQQPAVKPVAETVKGELNSSEDTRARWVSRTGEAGQETGVVGVLFEVNVGREGECSGNFVDVDCKECGA